MAIARGAGTEIIRTAMFEDIDSTATKLIIGEQHHIYTVLSIIITCAAVQTAGNQIQINLTVTGATTTFNSTTLTIDDKNIELGSTDSPTDTTADGGGITLKGTTDKTILYEKDTKSWDFNQRIITRSGEALRKSLHRSWVMGG